MLTKSNKLYQRDIYTANLTEAEIFEVGKAVQLEADQEKVQEIRRDLETIDDYFLTPYPANMKLQAIKRMVKHVLKERLGKGD